MKHVRVALIAAFVLALAAPAAWGWPSVGDGCLGCHTNFKGPGNLTHDLHVNGIVNGCTYCHTSVGDTPDTGSSGSDPNNACSGCHTSGGTAEHHITTAAHTCGCHAGDLRGLESDEPPYFGTAATSLTDACADAIDNDGDGLYDSKDSDCPAVPINGPSWTLIKAIYGE